MVLCYFYLVPGWQKKKKKKFYSSCKRFQGVQKMESNRPSLKFGYFISSTMLPLTYQFARQPGINKVQYVYQHLFNFHNLKRLFRY